MLQLQINPLVVDELKGLHNYIAEDNEEYATKTIQEIYSKFKNIQVSPGIGVNFRKGSVFEQIIGM